jgi:TatD DNase family protein
MLLSRRSRELLLHIPTEKLLTETDSPFTFNNNDSERMSSLLATIDGLAAIKQCRAEFIKEMVYENFKQLLA